mmetsp:Transcript_13160/g.26851  ORF Transcript_13160/g.26851 Transcript_13160/m.26851 type:complete len:193 (+) Transcript_13160:1021-1599(+)
MSGQFGRDDGGGGDGGGGGGGSDEEEEDGGHRGASGVGSKVMRRATALFSKIGGRGGGGDPTGIGDGSDGGSAGVVGLSLAGRRRNSFFGGAKKADILRKGARRSNLDREAGISKRSTGMGRDALEDDESDDEIDLAPAFSGAAASTLRGLDGASGGMAPSRMPARKMAARMSQHPGGKAARGGAGEHQNYV